MRPRTLRAALIACSLLLAGCGRAVSGPAVGPGESLAPGAPLLDLVRRHGCPEAVRPITSETFTFEVSRRRIEGILPGRVREERTSLVYLVRREKVVAVSLAETATSTSGLGSDRDETARLRARPWAGGLVLLAVLGSLAARAALRPRPPRRRLLVGSLVVLAAAFAREHEGIDAEPVSEGSPSALVLTQHGAPSEVRPLPNDAGTLLVFRRRERRHEVVAGSESATAITYLLQGSRVAAASSRVNEASAEYYLFPFYDLGPARGVDPPTVAWAAALAALAFSVARGARREKRRGASLEDRRAAPPPPPGMIAAP